MNYPVWDLYGLGGGFWIALIATVHVFVSHFAVGGGLFLVLTELKGLREGSPAILDGKIIAGMKSGKLFCINYPQNLIRERLFFHKFQNRIFRFSIYWEAKALCNSLII